MCEFLSAIKTKTKTGEDKYYYLTYSLIHNTPTGKLLQKKYGGDDLIGHSAIREFFELRENEGENWECTDFSNPKNFPAVIVRAIKRGEFKGNTIPEGLLLKPLHDKYMADRKPLYDKHLADCKPLDDKYLADRKTLDDKYQADRKSLYDKYQADCKPLYDKHWADRKPLDDKYQADRKTLDDKYQADIKPLYDKYWDLFANPENRRACWKEGQDNGNQK